MKKKIVAVGIMLGLAMSLVACGKGESKTETTVEESVQEIKMNESVDAETLQITLTGIGDFEKKYNMNKKDSLCVSKDGYNYVKITYKIKNIGKESWSNTPASFSMSYGDGYSFYADKYWYYHPDTYTSDMKTKGAWVNNFSDLSPFDDAMECAVVFELPEEVKDSSESWTMTISIQGKEYLYVIR